MCLIPQQKNCGFNVWLIWGAGANLEVASRLRNLFNRVITSGVYFDAANGPDIQETSSPPNYFQSQIRITFETVESL